MTMPPMDQVPSSGGASGIEKFRATLLAAEPGDNIGVLLSNGPPADVLRNRTLLFVPHEAFGRAHSSRCAGANRR